MSKTFRSLVALCACVAMGFGCSAAGGDRAGTGVSAGGSAGSVGTGAATGTGASSNTGVGGGTTGTGGTTSVGGTGTGTGGAGGTVVQPPGPFSVEMAKWPGNLDGAYTIIHDDLAPWVSSLYVTAGPELDAVGLDAAFGVIVEGVSGENIWSEVQELKDAGHEIINHSWTHADLSADGADLGLEMDSSHAEINTNLTSQSTTFFIFPYDAANQIGLDRLKGLGYLGARAGERGGLNGPDWADDFRLNFDVWGPGESMYEELGPCADESGSDPSDFTEECRHYVLNQYVDDTLAMNGWGIREFHGVEDNSWQSVSLADYQQHLTYVKAKVDAGALWVATPSRVIHYRRAREACQPTVTEQQIVFGTPTAACTTHLAPFQTLTLIVVANESMPTSMTVTQNGVSIPTTSLGSGRFQLEINPTAGDATISAL